MLAERRPASMLYGRMSDAQAYLDRVKEYRRLLEQTDDPFIAGCLSELVWQYEELAADLGERAETAPSEK